MTTYTARTNGLPVSTSLVKCIGELDSKEAHATSLENSEVRDLVERYIAPIGGPLSSDQMCDSMETWLAEWRNEPMPSIWRRGSGLANARMRALEKRIYQMLPEHNNSRGYVEHVFSELTPEDIDVRLERLRRALGRFQNVRARKHSTNVFELTTS